MLVPEGIAFWDASQGLAWFVRASRCPHADCSLLAETSDGGRTWLTVFHPSSVTQVAVSRGTTDAWLVEDNCDYWVVCRPRLLRSSDRGRSWQGVGLGVLALTAPTSKVWFGALYDKSDRWSLKRTRDGGRSWSDVRSPCREQGPWGAPRSWFTTVVEGWLLCGGQPGAGHQLKAVFRTHDGGRSWRMVMSTGWRPGGASSPGAIPDAGYASGIAAAGGRAWIWQDRFRSYTSVDGGHRWAPIGFTNANGVEIEDLAPISRNVAFALVHLTWRRRELRRTDDGGRTWRVIHVWRYG